MQMQSVTANASKARVGGIAPPGALSKNRSKERSNIQLPNIETEAVALS